MADRGGARPTPRGSARTPRAASRPPGRRSRRPALPIAAGLVALLAGVGATVTLLTVHHHGAAAAGRGGATARDGSRSGSRGTSSPPSPTAAPTTTSPTTTSPTTTSPTTTSPTTTSAPTTTTAPTTTAPTTTTAPPVASGVGLERCTFVDTSRTTYDYATGKTLPERTLVTEVRYPTASPAVPDAAGEVLGARPVARAGGYPTIFFAPGYDVTPDAYVRLLDAWVNAGFAVVAPIFPDTNPTAVAAATHGYPEDDLTNQPADLAFVLRSSLAASRGATEGCPVLRGLLDPAEVAVAGQSDGGDTVALLAYGTSGPGTGAGAGLPIRAAAVLSGSEWQGDAYGAPAGAPPLLVVQSATDRCNPPQQSVLLYDAVGETGKWFLTLRDADHLGPYDGDDTAAFRSVVAVTTRFFHLELTGRTPTTASLTAGGALAGAALTTGPTAPTLPVLTFSKAACARPGAVTPS